LERGQEFRRLRRKESQKKTDAMRSSKTKKFIENKTIFLLETVANEIFI